MAMAIMESSREAAEGSRLAKRVLALQRCKERKRQSLRKTRYRSSFRLPVPTAHSLAMCLNRYSCRTLPTKDFYSHRIKTQIVFFALFSIHFFFDFTLIAVSSCALSQTSIFYIDRLLRMGDCTVKASRLP